MTAEPRTAPTPIAPPLPDGLDTPVLVIDLDIVERNAARMSAAAKEHGIALRPHVKTHKSVALARLQVNSGAAGITVGTLGEAEVMADGGISDIFLAYPVWAAGPKAARLRALAERPGLKFAVGADSAAGVEQLANAMRGSSARLRVMIEIDPHYGRTGVTPDSVAEIGRAVESAGLELLGLFGHGGHAYAGGDAIGSAARDELEALSVGEEVLVAAGMSPRVLSAGSSPTALGVLAAPVNEVRPGTYLIGDRMQTYLGATPRDGVAIAVAATVVSAAVDGQIVIDAGAKSLTKDMAPYMNGYGCIPAYPDGVIERVSDYHGQVRFPAGAPRPTLGEVVAVVPNHACPAIDLFDSFAATRSGSLIGWWKVDARGRSG
ncbi:MAG TPA: alanine racemase [Candidatus Limnocylindria bacterium]|nr:alanine racemase [Candidatus Limnocylindria bacterium]